jgi:hypothetical protein
MMPILYFGQVQLETRCRAFAGMTIPSIGKKNAADIYKHTGDYWHFLHRFCSVIASPLPVARLRAVALGTI